MPHLVCTSESIARGLRIHAGSKGTAATLPTWGLASEQSSVVAQRRTPQAKIAPTIRCAFFRHLRCHLHTSPLSSTRTDLAEVHWVVREAHRCLDPPPGASMLERGEEMGWGAALGLPAKPRVLEAQIS